MRLQGSQVLQERYLTIYCKEDGSISVCMAMSIINSTQDFLLQLYNNISTRVPLVCILKLRGTSSAERFRYCWLEASRSQQSNQWLLQRPEFDVTSPGYSPIWSSTIQI